MRYFVILILFFPVILAGQTTPNLHLNLPPPGTQDYGPILNANFTLLDNFLAGVTPLPVPVGFACQPLASLGSPNATFMSIACCSDCQVTNPCTVGGSGALAVGINGVWQCPSAAVVPPPPGQFSVLPSSLSFGSVSIGSASPPQTVTLTNGTSGTVSSIVIGISGTNASDFTISSNTCGSSLSASATCSLNVTFQPTVSGVESATLTVTDSDLSSPTTIALNGIGFAQTSLLLNPTSLAYGTVVVGNAVQQTFTIYGGPSPGVPNTSSVTIQSINSVDTIDPINPYTEFDNCLQTLDPGKSCTVTVTFTPAAAVSYGNGTIVVTSTAQGSPQTVTLTGTGATTAPPTLSSIALAPTSATITNVAPTNTKQLVATNTYSDSSTKVVTNKVEFSTTTTIGTATPTLINTPYTNNSDCGYQTTASTIPCPQTGTMAVTQGKLGVCEVHGANAAMSLSVTDSLGNVWTQVGSTQQGTVGGQVTGFGVFYTFFKSTNTDVITGRSGIGNITRIGVDCSEWDGVDPVTPLDKSSYVNAGGSTSISGGAVTPTGAGELGICFMVDAAVNNVITDTTTGATVLGLSNQAPPSGANHYSAAQSYKVTGSAMTCTGTEGGGNTATWQAGTVFFNPAGGSSSSPVVAVGSSDCVSNAGCTPSNASGVVTGIAVGGPATVAVNSGFYTGNTSTAATITTGVTTMNAQLPQPVAANQTLVAIIATQDTSSTMGTPSDSSTNTWSCPVARQAGTGIAQKICIAQNVAATPQLILTETFGAGGATNPEIRLFTLDGLLAAAGTDGTAVAVTSTSQTGVNITTSASAYDVVVFGASSAGGKFNVNPPNMCGFGTSEGGLVIATTLGGTACWFDTFATGTFPTGTSYTSAVSAVSQALALKSIGNTAAITVTSGTSGLFTSANQQPVTNVFLPGSLWTTALPTRITNGTNDQSNSAAVVASIFGGRDNNIPQGNIPNCFSSTPGGNSCGNTKTFCYASQSNPVYQVKSCADPATQAANNPVGKFFHLKPGCEFASNIDDQNIAVWDQSLDIDATAGGRILASYDFANTSTPRSISSSCTCTTTACAAATPACQLNWNHCDYNHPYNDPLQGIGDGKAWSNMNAGAGAAFLRDQEWIQGTINHPLQINLNCVAAAPVFPSTGGAFTCANQTNAPAVGNLLYLDSGFNCAALPVWQRPICIAAQTYGAYVTATSGGANGVGIFLNQNVESPIAEFEDGIDLNASGQFFNFLSPFSTGTGSPPTPVFCNGSPVNRCNVYALDNMSGAVTGGHWHVAKSCAVQTMAGVPGGC